MTTDPPTIPPTTRGLAISNYGPPSSYAISSLPTPSPPPDTPSSLLIRVHSSALNPGDVKLASGMFRLFSPLTFPYVIGTDFSGTVASPGNPRFPPGLPVFGSAEISSQHGSIAEYTLIDESRVERKPEGMHFGEAAGLGVVGITAVKALDKIKPEEVQGKTVFVSAGLGGVGSVLAQLAKRELGAAKVITSVSSAKVPRVAELLGEGVVDVVVDYQKEDVLQKVGEGTVDVYFDSCGTASSHLAMMKKGGKVVSATALVPGKEMKRLMPSGIPWLLARVMDLVAWWGRWRAGRWGVTWEPVLGCLDKGGNELETIRRWVEEGKFRMVVGETVQLKEDEVHRIRALAEELGKGKGAVGKIVVQVAED